jgi:hypothetical protein
MGPYAVGARKVPPRASTPSTAVQWMSAERRSARVSHVYSDTLNASTRASSAAPSPLPSSASSQIARSPASSPAASACPCRSSV